MELKTDRLLLRDLVEEDAEEFTQQGNDFDINFFNWYIPYPLTIDKAKNIIKKRSINPESHRWLYELGIFIKETGKFAGIVSLYDVSKPEKKAKLGYWLGKEYRGNGYSKEAILSLIFFTFNNLLLNKISAKSLSENYISNKLLESLGFRKIGVSKWDKILQGKKYDVFEWELLNPLFKDE
jgi:[ribosomal protein S5]-alanine N-acetyltransferase